MCTVLIIRGIQVEVAIPAVSNVPFYHLFTATAERKKECMLNQPQTDQRYMERMSLQYRQDSEVIFFPSGERRPRCGGGHMRGTAHLWEASGKYQKYSCTRCMVHWNRAGHVGLHSQTFLSIVFTYQEFQEQRCAAEEEWRNVALIFRNEVTDEVAFLLLIYVQETECLSVPRVLNKLETGLLTFVDLLWKELEWFSASSAVNHH